MLGETADLNEFLFGSERVALAVVRPVLLAIRQGRCFCCHAALKPAATHVGPLHRLGTGHNFVRFTTGQAAAVPYDGMQMDDLTLEKVLRILDDAEDGHVRAFFSLKGLDLSAVKRAIRKVKNHRNRAAHEGGYGFEYARQIHLDWL